MQWASAFSAVRGGDALYPNDFWRTCFSTDHHKIWCCHNLGAPVPTTFTNPSQIGRESADPWSTLTCQISFKSGYCGQKTAILTNFEVWGLVGYYTNPSLYQLGSNLVCYSRLMVYAYVLNFVSVALFCHWPHHGPTQGRKTPNFAIFCFDILWCRKLAAYRKVQYRWISTNVHLSNGIKIVYLFQLLLGKIMRRTLSLRSVMD